MDERYVERSDHYFDMLNAEDKIADLERDKERLERENAALLADADKLTRYSIHHAPCAAQRRAEGEAQRAAGKTGPHDYSCSCGLDELLTRYQRPVAALSAEGGNGDG